MSHEFSWIKHLQARAAKTAKGCNVLGLAEGCAIDVYANQQSETAINQAKPINQRPKGVINQRFLRD